MSKLPGGRGKQQFGIGPFVARSRPVGQQFPTTIITDPIALGLPSDWTQVSGTFTAQVVADYSTGYTDKILNTSSASASGDITWNVPGSNIDQDILVLFKVTTAVNTGNYTACWSRYTAGPNGYFVGFFANSTSGGVQTNLQSFGSGALNTNSSFNWSVNTWYWVRLTCSGTTISYKVWALNDPEPSTPLLSVTDTTFASGSAAARLSVVGSNIAVFSVGSEGLPAPFPSLLPPADTTHVLRAPLYTPRYPVVWYRDWSQNPLESTLTPAAAPFAQKDWPLSFAQVPASNLRVWTQSYNLNLIGKDRLPTGEVVTDLTPRAYEHHVQLRSWAWSYNLNLIGKDRFPPGQVVYDLPPRAPQQPAQTWTWNYNLNLIGKDQLPVGETTTDLPRQQASVLQTWIVSLNPLLAVAPVPFTQSEWPLPAALQQAGRTWTWSYNLNLIGQDKLPVGEQSFDLPPRGYDYAAHLRTWLGAIPRVPAVVVTLPPGEIVTDRPSLSPERARSTDQQNPLTSTLFVPPTAPDTTHIPRAPFYINLREWAYHVQLRTWLQSPRVPTTVAKPFAQYDWPLPAVQNYPFVALRTVFGGMPPVEEITPPAETAIPRSPLYAARPPVSVFQTWTQSVSLALTIAPVQRPFNQKDWPLSFGPRQPAFSFTASYNLNLIGKDQLPVGDVTTDLAPRPAPPLFQTWVLSSNLPLTVTPAVFPVGKTSTALPAQPPRADLGFTESFDLSLIGQDQLPTGESVTDLPPQPALRAIELRTWIQSVNLALTVTPPVKPFNQTDWPVPRGAQQPALGFTAFYNPNLVGQDRLPFRQTDWSLPVPPADGRTWIQSVNLALTAAPQPFNQTDWPNSRGAQQPTLGFAASFNLNLIGKDQLPNGEVVTDLAPRGPLTPVQLYTWVQTVNLALIAPTPVFPVGKTSLGLPTLRQVFTAPQDLPPQNIVILGPPSPPVVVPPGGGGERWPRYSWRWCDFTDREWFKAFCEEFYRLKSLKSPELRRQQLADLEQALDLAIERAVGGSGEPEWTFDIRTAGGMLQDEIGSSDAFDRIASGLARLALEIDDEEAFLLLGS